MIRNIFRSSDKKKRQRRRLRDVKTIAASGLFDPDWYARNYPDSSNFPDGPIAHYVVHGAQEGRSAGPRFDTRAYLRANPDVQALGINPLVHYIQYGAVERRTFGTDMAPVRRVRVAVQTKPTSFSLIVNAGGSSHLDATLRSLAKISDATFEVVLDPHAASAGAAHLSKHRKGDGNGAIRTVDATDPHAFLRSAIETASNDFIVILDHGDVVQEKALAELSRFIGERGCDVAYGDERQASNGTAGDQVVLKPGWSPELLTSFNYFGRLTAIRRTLALRALPPSGSAREWELNLRVAELTTAIEHLPIVLCSRTRAQKHDSRLPDQEAPAHAEVLQRYWRSRGHDALIARAPDGTFRASWPMPDNPLVSIIIPNKNCADLLRTCAEGLYGKTAYDNIELIVVDNGWTDPDTLRLYDELQAKSARIVPFDEAFNYSRACNLGAKEARGSILLFLNNDIEVVEPNWLHELVRQASEPGVGVVGAKLLYPDGEIQHAGVALGLFTLAAHVFHRAAEDRSGPFGTPHTTRNWVAVTGACQLMRREVFDLVNGYDENFLISYSDVVLCMQAVRAGFRTVYVPSAVLVHHEGASRGHTNPSSDQVLFAKRVRSLGFASDPYFHRGLDTQSFVPKLLKQVPPSSDLTPMQVDIDRLAGACHGALDIFDDGLVAKAASVPWDRVIWRFDPQSMQPGAVSGARILVEFIRRRPDLRKRFPRALRDGAQGGFATWVKTEGLRLLGLPQDHAKSIEAAFEADFGAAARKALVFDEALRKSVPLFLLPSGAKEACHALFDVLDHDIVTLEDIWWFLVASAEDPQGALCDTWAMTPAWQEAVPDGGTVFGVVDLARWAAEEYACDDDGIFAQTDPRNMPDAAQVRVAYRARAEWRARFPDAMTSEPAAHALLDYLASRASGLHFLPRAWVAERLGTTLAHDVVQPGVNILGHFAYPSGLRISAESMVEGLTLNEVALSLRDVPVSSATDEAIGHRFQGMEVYDTTIVHVQPEPLFKEAYPLAGLRPRYDPTYRIGLWYWEFDDVPASWNRVALDCDELWAATQFVADALKTRFRQPVHVLNPGIEIAPFDRKPRAAFGFRDEFVFVFVFHMTSVMERKNPLGLIRAFKEAFADEPRAKLVIKTSFGSRHPESFDLLKTAVEGANITLIDETFSREDTLSLIAAGDAYVSLHRSEGLGLTMAEAMLLARPVVATRYSGNLDFMDDRNSLLVDYRLVSLERDIPPYAAGLHWAQPSISHAAKQMRRLFDDPAFARELGERARHHMESRLNYRATGRAIADRLSDIARGNALRASDSGLSTGSVGRSSIGPSVPPRAPAWKGLIGVSQGSKDGRRRLHENPGSEHMTNSRQSSRVMLIKPRRLGDDRGWFMETWSRKALAALGIEADFVQDNHSLSRATGTLRGLHFQTPPHGQGKLVRCTAGRVMDYAVDVRRGSPTFGRWVGAELSAENGHQLWIPVGFAHAFVTLEPDTEIVYKCTDYYAPANDGGIRWDSVGIDWPLPPSGPVLSDKDTKLPALDDFDSPFDYDGEPLAAHLE